MGGGVIGLEFRASTTSWLGLEFTVVENGQDLSQPWDGDLSKELMKVMKNAKSKIWAFS